MIRKRSLILIRRATNKICNCKISKQYWFSNGKALEVMSLNFRWEIPDRTARIKLLNLKKKEEEKLPNIGSIQVVFFAKMP